MAFTLDNLLREKDMETASISGTMGRSSKESGRTAKRMDLEYGGLQREITIRVNGRTIGSTARGIMYILEGLSIEGILRIF